MIGTQVDTREVTEAVDRLIALAQGNDRTARAAANFLLSWLNHDDWGSFEIGEVHYLGAKGADDAAAIVRFLGTQSTALTPDALGRESAITQLVYQWRSLD